MSGDIGEYNPSAADIRSAGEETKERITQEANAFFDDLLNRPGRSIEGFEHLVSTYRQVIAEGEYLNPVSYQYEKDGRSFSGTGTAPYEYFTGALGKYRHFQETFASSDEASSQDYAARAARVQSILDGMDVELKAKGVAVDTWESVT
jgi:hypothetical protein